MYRIFKKTPKVILAKSIIVFIDIILFLLGNSIEKHVYQCVNKC